MSLAVCLLFWIPKDILYVVFGIKSSKVSGFVQAELAKAIGHIGAEVLKMLLLTGFLYLTLRPDFFLPQLMLNHTDPL